MFRHIVVFIYILSSFFGLLGIIFYWLASKKKAFHNAAERLRLRKFMISTFLIGLLSFFIFYSQCIIFLQPTNTTFRILDYLFWVCFIFYWIDYLDSTIKNIHLHKIKNLIKYGCLAYMIILIATVLHIWDINFYYISISGRVLFILLDILFCLSDLFIVVIYTIRGKSQVKSHLSSIYIFAISAALMVYTVWESLHYIQLFADLPISKPWDLDPFNITAFFLLFSNLITLVYVYHNDFAASFLMDEPATVVEDAKITFGKILTEDHTTKAPAEDFASEHKLTPREKEIMEFIYKGYNNAEIADELYISHNTVKHHIYNLFKKLKVRNRVEMICLLQKYYP